MDVLPALIARQAAATPDAVAVVDSRTRLSYAELDGRANRLASFLLGLDVIRPDALAAVCLRRSVDLVVALLGIWRVGMAYVPLDPDHPVERLAWQLADTGAGLVLTEQALAVLVHGRTARTVCLDADAEQIAAATERGSAGIWPSGAAYAMYTSGSTGRPKGVLIDHAGIANRVLWTVRRHGLSATDRVLQKTALTFDAAGWEVFAPLVSGGTVVLAPIGVERDPAALLRAVADYRITVLQTVPSVLRLLVEEPDWSGCDALRLVFSAGEPLHAGLCQRLLERVKVEVWNTYGPTECSIDATAEPFDAAQLSGPVSIGRPIDHVRVRLLDRGGMPVPVGVPGELHIGGVGVARGYVGRPSLTAERFVPDPFGPPGTRLYRTGDLARWRTDGTLAYLGRLDDQLKVDGVRIEPAEIEAALLTHPDVRGAVVKGYADASGVVRIAAYLLRRGIAEPESLREFLRRLLPGPLIPATFITLDAFPTTTSGKVDRGALPVPDSGAGSGRPPYRAPVDPGERLVAQAWSALLGVEPIGVDDDFFQLGGSSLLITRLASALGTAAGVEIAVPDLFGASTVTEQAGLVAAAQRAAEPIGPAPRDRPVPLSFGQRRQWLLDRMQPGSVEWLAPMFLNLAADVDVATVQRALDALARRHEVLRTRYPLGADGEPSQVVEPPGPVPLRVADGADGDLAAQFRREFATGFDLEHGPVVRGLLVRSSGPDQVLLLCMHHIACDGWSTVVLEREFRELCAALPEGREPALAAVPVQYADFAVWQRERLTDEALRPDLLFWRDTLRGIGHLDLPIDRPRPAQWDARGALAPVHVPADLADRVLRLGQRHGATAFMTLLTAYGMVLSRYCGQADIPVGVPVSGRVHPQLAGTVGFFLNSLVLRCDLSGDPSFVDALGRVRDMSLSCFAHQSLPFERLVDDLAPRRDASRTPLYQVELDIHEEGWTGTAFDTAGMDAFRRAWTVARSDLCLYLQRRDDGSMIGAIEYATALFDADTVNRFARHLVRLLESATTDPSAPLSTLELLAPDERELLSAGALRVLDRHGNLTPPGVPGEVHIGAQLYPTGERGRRRADGSLEWLGRLDSDLKVRDYRVDARQVERVLRRHDAVADTAVLARRRDEETVLRAFWASVAEATVGVPSEDDLAAHCGTQLEPHQIPAEFVRLDRIPRTVDGTVDRDALARGGDRPHGDGHAPRNPAEKRIAEIWAELLDAEAGVHTNFFSLGGNSILAIRMISAVRAEFAVEVSVRAFFENATIATLAEEVAARIRAELAELSDSEVLRELASRDGEAHPSPARTDP